MGFGKNIRLSSIVLFFLAAALAVLSTPDFIYGQSGIEMQVEGDLDVDGTMTATTVSGASLTASSGITATNGNVTALSAASILSGGYVTATCGDVTATNGNITAPNGKLGIGTSAIPRGNIGGGRLAIHGPTSSYLDGPHIQTTVQSDNYPVSTLLSNAHNDCGLFFDCYKEGLFYKSSSLSSNALIWKTYDWLYFFFQHDLTPGAIIFPCPGFVMGLTNGSISLPYVYGQTVGATRRDLYIDSLGKLGYVSSSIELKENVRDATAQDTVWIYGLRPVTFDYKDRTMGENQCGLIAEEVATVNTRIVSYKREISYGPEQLDENGQHTGYHPMIVTITNQPETVCYDQLTVPMLAEMQKLRSRVQQLEARVAQLEALEARVAALEAKSQP